MTDWVCESSAGLELSEHQENTRQDGWSANVWETGISADSGRTNWKEGMRAIRKDIQVPGVAMMLRMSIQDALALGSKLTA